MVIFFSIVDDREGGSDSGHSRGGCSSPHLTLNGTRVVPRSGMSPDFSTLSEVKFSAQLPSSSSKDTVIVGAPSAATETSSRICKIKCVSGQWVGPLCQGQFIYIINYNSIPVVF